MSEREVKTARQLSEEKYSQTEQPTNDRGRRIRRKGDALMGAKLRSRRLFFGLDQPEAAEALGLNHPQQLSMIECGRAMPSVRRLARLAAFYEISLDDLCSHMLAEELGRVGVSGEHGKG